MIYKKSDNICFSFSQGVATIRDKDSDLYYTTNDVSSVIWEMIDGKNSIDEIIAAIISEYEVSQSEAKDDVHVLLKEMEDLGLIIKT